MNCVFLLKINNQFKIRAEEIIMVQAVNFEMQVNSRFAAVSPTDQADFEFFLQNYCRHANEKGSLYTWGSGEMG